MKIKNNIDTKYVNIFEDGATFQSEYGERFIILRESNRKKRIFTVLRIRVNGTTDIDECTSEWLLTHKYIGTADITLDIKIKNTTGER